MQTYTHLVITAVLNRRLKRQEAAEAQRYPPLQTTSFLIGSVAPDMPLTVLAILFAFGDLWQRRTRPAESNSEDIKEDHQADEHQNRSNLGYLFGHLFFHSPWLKLAHNLFHAPFLTLFYTIVGHVGWRLGISWGAKLYWFGIACTLHTAIDIPLHHNDGPLLWFPLDWETRFISPVSYWDSDHHGRTFAIFEHLLLVVLLTWLAIDWRQASRKRT